MRRVSLGSTTIVTFVGGMIVFLFALLWAKLEDAVEGLTAGATHASESLWTVVLAAAFLGALAVLFWFILLVLVKRTVTKDAWRLGALARRSGSGADDSFVNLGRLNRRPDKKNLFQRVFADVLDDRREIERRLSLIIDNIGEGVITIDDKGVIGSFNPACERIFGWSAGAVIGKNVKMLMPAEQGKAHDGYLRRYLQSGKKHFDWSGRIEHARRADGSEFPIELTVTQIHISGRLLYVGIIRDISERELAEKAKAEFLATVSHELRTPLTSIRGALGLLHSGAVGDDEVKVRRLMGVALQNSDRLRSLIDTILEMEKLEAGKLELALEPLDLCGLVKAALEAYGGYAHEYGVLYQVSDSCPSVVVLGDREKLMRVMANLLSNATKFSPAGSVVRIAGQFDGTAKRIRVEVRDSGCGIPEAAQASIFEKFSQVDSSDQRHKGGTGLGLPIARQIIEMHGGTINVTSRVGAGSTFYFELPAEPGPGHA